MEKMFVFLNIFWEQSINGYGDKSYISELIIQFKKNHWIITEREGSVRLTSLY